MNNHTITCKVLDQLPLSILLMENDSSIRYVNSEFIRCFGRTPSSLEELWNLFAPDSETGVRFQQWREAADTEESLQLALLDRQGKLRRVVVNLVSLDDSEMIVLNENPSSMEESLISYRKMDALGQLAGGIAHDFNNFLGGIMGNAELLLKRLPEDEGVREYAETIIHITRQASRMTRQLLTFSRRDEPHFEGIDLHHIIDSALSLLKHTLDRKIEIHRDLAAESFHIMGDSAMIQNAIVNLALNACDAMPAGGRIIIRTSNGTINSGSGNNILLKARPGPCVRLRVEDTGKGIQKEMMESIFEPFFTTSDVESRSGIGLSVVFGIMEAHGGNIQVESEPGRGSAFTLCFPLLENRENPAEGKEANMETGPLPGEKRTILLVDDDHHMRRVVSRMLHFLDYEVIEATDGVEGIREFEKNREKIAAVLLDMIMPRMGGRETYTNMKMIDGSIPVIVITGYSHHGDLSPMRSEGIRAVLYKPFDLETLTTALGQTEQSST
jgi:signal transduction histidine kinase/ActR/RegA family two-component response regulator